MYKINRYDFAKAVVETRVLEKKMLSGPVIAKFLREKDINAIYKELKSSGYFKNSIKNLTKNNYDELLMTSFEEFIKEITYQATSYEFLDLIFLEYDIFNIKTIIMEKGNDLNYPTRPIEIPRERMERFLSLSQGTWFFIPSKYDSLYQEGEEIYQNEGAKKLQEYLDRKYFELILEISEQSGIPLFVQYSKSKIDFYNIMLVLRMIKIAERNKQIDKPLVEITMRENLIAGGYLALDDLISLYGKSQFKLKEYFSNSIYDTYFAEGIKVYGYDQDLSILERCMDNYLIHLCIQNKNIALGPEPIFGYLMGRKYEMINIRLILTSIFLNVPEHIIKERLRESYE